MSPWMPQNIEFTPEEERILDEINLEMASEVPDDDEEESADGTDNGEGDEE